VTENIQAKKWKVDAVVSLSELMPVVLLELAEHY